MHILQILMPTTVKKFWKQVHNDGCNKVKKFAVCVNGAVGDDNIAAMWKTHFESVYSSVNSSSVNSSCHTDNCLTVELMPWYLAHVLKFPWMTSLKYYPN